MPAANRATATETAMHSGLDFMGDRVRQDKYRDEANLQILLSNVENELRHCKEAKQKLADQRQLIWDAYTTIAHERLTLDDKLQSMTKQNESLVKQLEAAESQRQVVMSDQALMRENDRLRKELEQSFRLAADLRVEVAVGLNELQRMMGALEEMELQNESLKKENHRLHTGVDPTLNDLVGKYQIATVELNNAAVKIEALEKAITKLRGELLHANALAESLRQDSEANAIARRSLQAQVDNMNAEKEGLRIGTYWLSENVNQLSHKKKELSLEVKKDVEELAHVHAELEEERSKNAKLTAKLSEVAEELVCCQGKFTLVHHLEKPSSEASERCCRAVRHSALFTRAYATSIRKELAHSRSQTKAAEDKLRQAFEANKHLESEMRDLRLALSNDAASHTAEISGLTAKIGNLSKELIALEHQLASKQEGYKQMHESIDAQRNIAAQRMLADFETR